MITQRVVLVKDIMYVKNKKEVWIKKGTEVLIDKQKGVALYGVDHIEILPEEYSTIMLYH